MKKVNQFISNENGEIITIIKTDGLYVKLSNNQTLTFEKFLKDYKKI